MHHGFAQDLDTFSERVQDCHLLNLAEIVDQCLVKERENKKKVGKPGKGVYTCRTMNLDLELQSPPQRVAVISILNCLRLLPSN